MRRPPKRNKMGNAIKRAIEPEQYLFPAGGYLTVPITARYYLGLCESSVRKMCSDGVFPGVIKPGVKEWWIPRQAVIKHLNRKVTDE